MKYHIHIPKLLEFALNVVCDDVTLRGKNCLVTPIPYPLYLRCIMTYADKYGKNRYSIFRFYRDIRRNVKVSSQIGHLYPNVLDHVVLDDDDVNAELLYEVTQYPLVDDAIASIHRFTSRCLAADKSEMMVNAYSQLMNNYKPLSKPIIDVLLFYGAKLDPNHPDYFENACLRGTIVNDDVSQWISSGHEVHRDDVMAAIISGNCDTIRLVYRAYRESIHLEYCFLINLANASVEVMELLMSLNILEHGTCYSFSNIPSFSVLQWILDHDVMEHDRMLFDIASSAACYSGHYFDMLRYLIEQRNITVPCYVMMMDEFSHVTDLDILDYLIWHGADANTSVIDDNVLEHSPMLIRYWMDNGLVIQSNDVKSLIECASDGMTVPVLEMMIDKYELNVNAIDRSGRSALHSACRSSLHNVVEMLIKRGGDVNFHDRDGKTPYDMTSDDDIKQLLKCCESKQ